VPADAPEPRTVALAWRLAAVVATGAAVAVLAVRVADPDFAWLPFSDRDLLRAHDLGATPQIEGAEISHGSGVRVPGGAVYALLGLLERLGPQPDAVWRATTVLDGLAAALLGLVVTRRRGAVAGALAFALAATATATASTLTSLWNPSLVPLFATLAWAGLLGVVDARWAPGLAVLGLAAAIAAQLHLSAVPLALASVGVALATRPPAAGRWLAVAALLALGAYLPFLAVDGTEGFPRLRALGGVTPARGALGPALAGALGLLGGPVAPAVPTRVAPAALTAGAQAAVGALDVVLALGAVDLLRRRDPDGRIARATLPVVAAVVLAAVAGGFDAAKPGVGRHVLVAVPGLAALGALGLAAAARRLPATASVALALLVAAGFAGRGVALVLAHREQSAGPLAWGTLRARVEAVRAAAGGDLADVLGRTALVADASGPWRAAVPFDYPARLAGAAGDDRAPPCLAVLAPARGRPAASPDDALREAFPWARFGATRPLGDTPDGGRIVAWSPDGPCPTSFGNPWNPGARDAWVAAAPAAPLAVATLPASPGWPARRIVTVPQDDGRRRLPLLVEVVDTELVRVRLDAVWLRGDSAGFFPSGPLLDVAVDLVAGGVTRSIPIAPVLGPRGLVTPLVVAANDAALPGATATLRFRLPGGPALAVPLGPVTPPTPPRSP
jgi:hypothetical protein